MNFARWITLAGLLLAAGSAQAGTITPALQAEMDRTSADTPISIIVNLAEQAPIAQIDRELKERSATRAERNREVLTALQDVASRTQQPLLDDLSARMRDGSVAGFTSYWISNLVVVYANKAAIEQIASRADVDVVEPNFKAMLIEPIQAGAPEISDPDGLGALRGIGVPPGIRAINAPQVWYELGYDGTGALIGSLDTGVDGNHVALRTRWRGYNGAEPWQECWLDVLGGGTQFPSDGNGHGTHTTGTMTGLAPDDSIGVSPGSKWIACNAINQGVSGAFDQDVITAFQWFADPDGNVNTVDDVPDVVQNSWGVYEGLGYPANCDNRWWAVIDNCEAAGVVTTWSAGNEGPGAQSLRSPADRATTLYNCFSVGAVDATNYNWPYPIAGFSSRGPSGCTGLPPENLLKPEVSAPGVDVYSSIPGGGYSQGYSGTSMAGPHAAGIVGLMRQANPNIGVDDVKQILMETARDEGTAGEDNTFGWGFVDAYAAVIAATVGFGQIEGHVTNASWSDVPIQGAQVKVVGASNHWNTDASGFYHGSAAAGFYAIEASHPSFQPDTAMVVITANELTVQDFSLIDVAGPTITNVSDPKTTTDTAGPYPIQATVTDFSTVSSVKLYYRLNGGGWIESMMVPAGNVYAANIPGMPAGTQIDFYIWAQDGIGLVATSPADAPAGFYSLFVTEIFYSYDVEDPGDANWQLGAAGDNATSGIWVREDPVGTVYEGAVVQCEDDHTPAPGIKCFVTGNGTVGGAAGENDVDGGCTTLISPLYDLSEADMAFLSYWRWFGMGGLSADDEFEVDISGDDGATWIPLERVPNNDTVWRKITVAIHDLMPLSAQMRVRFRACDLGSGGLIEAGIDDVAVETFTPNPADVIDGAPALRTALAQNQPNPFNPVTMIRFALSNPGQARIEIFDAAGRLVRVLADEPMTAGVHQIEWNGMDDMGRPVGSGVYFYRLRSGVFEQSRRMTILK